MCCFWWTIAILFLYCLNIDFRLSQESFIEFNSISISISINHWIPIPLSHLTISVRQLQLFKEECFNWCSSRKHLLINIYTSHITCKYKWFIRIQCFLQILLINRRRPPIEAACHQFLCNLKNINFLWQILLSYLKIKIKI